MTTNARRAAKSQHVQVEPMESRQLMSGSPWVVIGSPTIVEGTGGTTMVHFSVRLTSPSSSPVSVDYQTGDRTAIAGSDYVAAAGTLTFAAGETAKTIPVAINPDTVIETTEALSMTLSDAKNGIIAQAVAVCSILDDDTPVDPTLKVSDVVMTRGYSGWRAMTFSVSLNTALTRTVTVKASTVALTARAGVDFQAKTQDLVFEPGERTKLVTVWISGTSTLTPDKVLYLQLSGGSVPIARSNGVGILKYGQ